VCLGHDGNNGWVRSRHNSPLDPNPHELARVPCSAPARCPQIINRLRPPCVLLKLTLDPRVCTQGASSHADGVVTLSQRRTIKVHSAVNAGWWSCSGLWFKQKPRPTHGVAPQR
jgi:hypothetical protein